MTAEAEAAVSCCYLSFITFVLSGVASIM